MTRIFRSSLRSRLLLLVLLALLPAFVLILVTAWEQRQLAAMEAQESALRVARAAASNQERLIEGARSLLIGISQVPAGPPPGSPRGCGTLLPDLRRRFPIYVNLSEATAGGDLTCSAQPLRGLISVADQPYFLRAKATHDVVVSGYVVEPVTGRPALTVAWPALGPTGELRRVFFASVDLGGILSFAERARLPSNSIFVVADAGGMVLARHPESERWVGQPLPEQAIAQAIRAQQSEGRVTVDGVDGITRLFAFTPVGGLPPADRLYFAVGISREEVFTEADRSLVRNLLSLGLVGAVALGMAAIIGHILIIRRLREVVRTAEIVRAGDLSARADVGGNDEIALMGSAFNAMAERLASMVKAEQETRDGLAERVNELDLTNRLGELLQACLTVQEAYAVIERILKELFRGDSGAVFMCSSSRNLIEVVARWGPTPQSTAGVFAIEECWALRSGRAHVVDDMRTGPLCTHLPSPAPRAYLCTPLVAQGDALGILYLGFSARGRLSPEPLTECQAARRRHRGRARRAGARQRAAPRGAPQPVDPRSPHRALQPALHGGDAGARGAARAARRAAHGRAHARPRPLQAASTTTTTTTRATPSCAELGRRLLAQPPASRTWRAGSAARSSCSCCPRPRSPTRSAAPRSCASEIKRLRVSDKGRLLGPVTISIGLAAYPEHGLAGDTLLHAADAALYRAKREGRDRVVIGEAEIPGRGSPRSISSFRRAGPGAGGRRGSEDHEARVRSTRRGWAPSGPFAHEFRRRANGSLDPCPAPPSAPQREPAKPTAAL